MKFFSNIRLLLLALWLGAAVFFIGVAQSAFAVLTDRELAGAVVNRNLTILNFAGMGIALILILTSLIATGTINKFWLWIERLLLIVFAAACVIGQFVIGLWLASIRLQMSGPIDQLAIDDPLRIQFNTVHQYSVWVLFTAMAAVLITFFILSSRKFGAAASGKADVYDFSKEFKV